MRVLIPATIASCLAVATLLLSEPRTAFDPPPLVQANSVSERDVVNALAQSPFRSDLWLCLASREKGSRAERALTAAYLVGGEKIEDIPVRLRLAVLSGAFRTDALHEFVKADVSLIALRAPSLKPLLPDIQTTLGPDQRPAFDALLRGVDPTLATH